jgi:hypothetical protein
MLNDQPATRPESEIGCEQVNEFVATAIHVVYHHLHSSPIAVAQPYAACGCPVRVPVTPSTSPA